MTDVLSSEGNKTDRGGRGVTDLLSPEGTKAGTVDLDESYFAIEPNVSVMAQVVTAQLAARRAGTQSTKTRSEKRGGGAKPWAQKGTGRARAGSSRSPIWRGGGVALGPKPRSYAQRTPKKMVRLALRSALSDRAAEGKVLVVDAWGFDAPSTKSAKAALAAIGAEGRILVVLGADDAIAARSFRNLPDVQLMLDRELNAYDVLVSDVIVFTQATLPSSAPSAGQAATVDPGVGGAVVGDPTTGQTATTEPVAAEPVAAEPITTEPVTSEEEAK